MDDSDIRKLLRFTLSEKRVIDELQIPPDAFIPLLFSIRYGGDWSLRKNSGRFMAVKEKVTRFDEDEMTGRTLEIVYLFLNPRVVREEGTVYRLEKCGSKNERELVKRPYRVVVDGDYILRAVLDPLDFKIKLKRLRKPLKFTGSGAYGVSHEMEHLEGRESRGTPFWEFKYEIEDD
ncbi:RimK/LysX family protein [Methanothermobacter sp.]|uniref:putative ATP-dependent zinc protease n=1 Tax=Methanothermobacter sp. TaxID=1884223 RepID=UPI003C733185